MLKPRWGHRSNSRPRARCLSRAARAVACFPPPRRLQERPLQAASASYAAWNHCPVWVGSWHSSRCLDGGGSLRLRRVVPRVPFAGWSAPLSLSCQRQAGAMPTQAAWGSLWPGPPLTPLLAAPSQGLAPCPPETVWQGLTVCPSERRVPFPSPKGQLHLERLCVAAGDWAATGGSESQQDGVKLQFGHPWSGGLHVHRVALWTKGSKMHRNSSKSHCFFCFLLCLGAMGNLFHKYFHIVLPQVLMIIPSPHPASADRAGRAVAGAAPACSLMTSSSAGCTGNSPAPYHTPGRLVLSCFLGAIVSS